MSAIVPAPTATAGAPKLPDKNRHINTVPIFWLRPVAIVKRIEVGKLMRYTAFRPKVSEIGAPIMGPNALVIVRKRSTSRSSALTYLNPHNRVKTKYGHSLAGIEMLSYLRDAGGVHRGAEHPRSRQPGIEP